MRTFAVLVGVAAFVTVVLAVLWPLLRISRDPEHDLPGPILDGEQPDRPDPVVSLDVRPLPDRPDAGWRIERRPSTAGEDDRATRDGL